MKKINAHKELARIQSNKVAITNNSKVKTSFLPALVIVASAALMINATFSQQLQKDNNYSITLNIINGNVDTYIKTVEKGYFEDTIKTESNNGTIICSKGELDYNPNTKKIYTQSVTEDIECTLTLEKQIVIDDDKPYINDNYGKSYYYLISSNNYIKINNETFRIIRINGNGTYRILLDRSIPIQNTIDETLNIWLNTFNYDKIVEADYDTLNLDEPKSTLVNILGYKISKVGLLSLSEANLIIDSQSDINTILENKTQNNELWIIEKNVIKKAESYNLIRPVINININIKTLDGEGTKENPYIVVE